LTFFCVKRLLEELHFPHAVVEVAIKFPHRFFGTRAVHSLLGMNLLDEFPDFVNRGVELRDVAMKLLKMLIASGWLGLLFFARAGHFPGLHIGHL
jgi:hypothetical protein